MNGLIKVTVKGDQQLVSARELYKGLEIKRRFSAWVEQNFKDFEETIDFTSVLVSTEVPNNGGFQERKLKDYAVTIDMAKQLCMMSHTELGKKYRATLSNWSGSGMIHKKLLSVGMQSYKTKTLS